jgi:ectoine hydroxylase-related dioxygenase (phytanoyl-CoA dioxygenase family)
MEKAITERGIEALVREVTDEEVAFYQEYGWVMMKQLVTPEFATELLRVGKEWRQSREKEGGKSFAGLALDETAEPFRSFMFSERMAKNAKRLVNRKRLKGVDIPLRYRIDMLLLKPPGAAGATYHQDASEHGSDRVGELQFWLALAEVTAEMSAMRFVNRSHREGPLGSVFNDDRGDLLKQYPMLISELGLSSPFHYQPGDCTVHHGYTVHGGPDNTTDRPRWSYLFSYSPADTRYWNGNNRNWGSERKRMGDADNPIVHIQGTDETWS